MAVTDVLLDPLLQRLGLDRSLREQYRIASLHGRAEGVGFSRELLQLSAPMVVRGLLNFAVLQMSDAWEYPYWVRRQLDPESLHFVPRSQNPLLINVTHRRWTMVGTPHGEHETVVDPRGLVTPLPHEWSIDIWLEVDGVLHLPAQQTAVTQTATTSHPSVTTVFAVADVVCNTHVFVASTRRGHDLLVLRATLETRSDHARDATVYVAVRPFNPEGVAPITSIGHASPHELSVNGNVAVIFARQPDWTACSNDRGGDLAGHLRRGEGRLDSERLQQHATCPLGRAHAVAAYHLTPSTEAAQHVDVAVPLDARTPQPAASVRRSWRIDRDRRYQREQELWTRERTTGVVYRFGVRQIQDVFDASLLALLQLCDNDTITPGPWIYHRFWYRDAAPMLAALDVCGHHARVRAVIDRFPEGLTAEGFFRGPDGEWDSNGAVLHTILQHHARTRSDSWLRRWYPDLVRAGDWIVRTCRQTANGLPPAGFSAEHLGASDQYYWDAFWCLAGLRSLGDIAATLGHAEAAAQRRNETAHLEACIRAAVGDDEAVIAGAPGRAFDASAIGSLCAVYPLDLFDGTWAAAEETVRSLDARYMTARGWYHPIIHSGYNPYMTMQIAHALLLLGDVEAAWKAAHPIVHETQTPWSLPEAMHPRGGGSMGDGHHGWAAAEIVLFLRDCVVMERGTVLHLLHGATREMLAGAADWTIENAPTRFGTVSLRVRIGARRIEIDVRLRLHAGVTCDGIDIRLPWPVRKAASMPTHAVECRVNEEVTFLRCSADVHVLLCEI